MQGGSAAEEKVEGEFRTLESSESLLEIFNQRLDGCLSSKKL